MYLLVCLPCWTIALHPTRLFQIILIFFFYPLAHVSIETKKHTWFSFSLAIFPLPPLFCRTCIPQLVQSWIGVSVEGDEWKRKSKRVQYKRSRLSFALVKFIYQCLSLFFVVVVIFFFFLFLVFVQTAKISEREMVKLCACVASAASAVFSVSEQLCVGCSGIWSLSIGFSHFFFFSFYGVEGAQVDARSVARR